MESIEAIKWKREIRAEGVRRNSEEDREKGFGGEKKNAEKRDERETGRRKIMV